MNNQVVPRIEPVTIFGKAHRIRIDNDFIRKLNLLPEKQRQIIELYLGLTDGKKRNNAEVLKALKLKKNPSNQSAIRKDFKAGLWQIIYLSEISPENTELESSLEKAIQKARKNHLEKLWILDRKNTETMIETVEKVLKQYGINTIPKLKTIMADGLIHPSLIPRIGKSAIGFMKEILKAD